MRYTLISFVWIHGESRCIHLGAFLSRNRRAVWSLTFCNSSLTLSENARVNLCTTVTWLAGLHVSHIFSNPSQRAYSAKWRLNWGLFPHVEIWWQLIKQPCRIHWKCSKNGKLCSSAGQCGRNVGDNPDGARPNTSLGATCDNHQRAGWRGMSRASSASVTCESSSQPDAAAFIFTGLRSNFQAVGSWRYSGTSTPKRVVILLKIARRRRLTFRAGLCKFHRLFFTSKEAIIGGFANFRGSWWHAFVSAKFSVFEKFARNDYAEICITSLHYSFRKMGNRFERWR